MGWSSTSGWSDDSGWSRRTASAGNTLNPLRGTTGQTSPSVSLTGGNLTAAFNSTDGCSMSVSGTSGTATFTVHVDTLGSGDSMWIGVASSSHATTDAGNSWAGGDAFASGAYNQSGTAYQVGGSAGNIPDFVFVAGDTVTVVVDAVAHTMTMHVNAGASQTLTAPSGTLYAAIGLGTSGAQATINLTSFP